MVVNCGGAAGRAPKQAGCSGTPPAPVCPALQPSWTCRPANNLPQTLLHPHAAHPPTHLCEQARKGGGGEKLVPDLGQHAAHCRGLCRALALAAVGSGGRVAQVALLVAGPHRLPAAADARIVRRHLPAARLGCCVCRRDGCAHLLRPGGGQEVLQLHRPLLLKRRLQLGPVGLLRWRAAGQASGEVEGQAAMPCAQGAGWATWTCSRMLPHHKRQPC